jgi:hypothetical protein
MRWDDAAIAVVDAVLALRMARSDDIRAEIASRLGVPFVTDHQLRNAYARRGRKFSYAGPPSSRNDSPHTARGLGDAEPPTQRSERVPTTAPPPSARVEVAETACRAFVAPMVREPGPEDHECVAAFPDIHFGVHDQRAVDQALEVVHAYRPKSVVVLGDTLDGAAFSRHQRSRRPISFNDELAYARPFFKACEELGARNLVYCKGNHEHRLETYLHTHATAVADLPGNTLEQMIDLSAWRVVPYHQGIDIGPVHYTHDIGYCGVNAVRQALTRHAVSSFVQGHLHTATTIMLNIGAQNRPLWSASFGWLGDPDQVDWRSQSMVRRECPHAIGIIRGGENGWHSMETVRIQRGGTMVNGRWIK